MRGIARRAAWGRKQFLDCNSRPAPIVSRRVVGAMVLADVDLVTLMELGGWASLAMVQRYATIRGDHRREAIARIA